MQHLRGMWRPVADLLALCRAKHTSPTPSWGASTRFSLLTPRRFARASSGTG